MIIDIDITIRLILLAIGVLFGIGCYRSAVDALDFYLVGEHKEFIKCTVESVAFGIVTIGSVATAIAVRWF